MEENCGNLNVQVYKDAYVPVLIKGRKEVGVYRFMLKCKVF